MPKLYAWTGPEGLKLRWFWERRAQLRSLEWPVNAIAADSWNPDVCRRTKRVN